MSIKGWAWLSGGASATFKTIQTPSGTSPVATGPNDILTLSAGSNITITGDATTDTVTIAASGGSPGGSATQLQYNNSGVFGGLPNSSVDFTNAYLGLGNVTPTVTLQVAGSQTTTPAPTSFSVSQVAEQSNTASSVTTAITYGPEISDNVGTVSATQNNGSGTYFADGSTSISYNVYAVRVFNGQYYFRGNAQGTSFTDNNDANNFTVGLSWTVVSNCDGYILTASGSANNGNPNFSIFISGSGNNSFNDDGAQSGSDTPQSWDSLAYPYDPGGTAPTAPTGTPNQVRTNVGFGNYFSDGRTWAYDIDTATQINSVWYCSGSPVSVSANDTNDGQFYDWYLDNWSLGGGSETDLIVRRTSDGGSNYEYFFVSLGTSFTDGGLSNDTTAAARWGQTYGGPPATVTRSYKAYGYGYSPTNSTQWFSSSFNGYSAVANNDVNGYVITHTVTQGSRGYSRILGDYYAVGDYSSFYDTSASSFIEGGSNIWTAGSTVTPIHYGILASGQTRYWRLYAQKTSPTTIYSSSYLSGQSTLPNDSNYYTFNFSWTAGTGSTNTKILESTNGSSYTIGRLQGGTSIVREDAAPSFSDGTTVTPNTLDAQAIIGQNSNTISTGAGQIVAKATTPSTGLAMYEMQKSDATVMGRLYADSSTGNVSLFTLGTKVSFNNNSAGNYADLGLVETLFNKTNQSSYEFKINANSTSNGFKFIPGTSGQPKVFIGQTSTDYSGALQIINNTDIKNLYLRRASGQTSNIIEVVNEGSGYLYRVDVSGKVTIGSPSVTSNWLNFQAGTTSIAPIKFESGSLLTTAQAGALEFLTEDFYMTHTSSRRHPISSNNNPIGNQVFS